MSSRMRATRSKTRKRRSHHGLKAPRLSRDKETGSVHLRHRVDMKTGMYRGKKIFDAEAIALKKAERARRKKEERGEKATE